MSKNIVAYKVAIEKSVHGKGGGPYVSSSRIMSSELKEKYCFCVINYDTNIGGAISVARIKDVLRQIKIINPHLVHFSGLQLQGFHMAVACKIANVKCIMTIRGSSSDMIYFGAVKKLIMKYIVEPVTMALVDKFYCVSKFVAAKKICNIFIRKSCGVVYNYPPLPTKQKIENDLCIRDELGLSSEDFLIVSVGRITKDKGYHILEDAIKKILEHHDGVKFLIVGDGSYRDEMEINISEFVDSKKVFFLGYRDDVDLINGDSDAFVLPTLHETLSLALLEASVAGLPLIASNTGGVPEIVEDGYNGFLVNPNDYNEIVEKLTWVILNREAAKKMGENARVNVRNKFSHSEISRRIDGIYQLVLEG